MRGSLSIDSILARDERPFWRPRDFSRIRIRSTILRIGRTGTRQERFSTLEYLLIIVITSLIYGAIREREGGVRAHDDREISAIVDDTWWRYVTTIKLLLWNKGHVMTIQHVRVLSQNSCSPPMKVNRPQRGRGSSWPCDVTRIRFLVVSWHASRRCFGVLPSSKVCLQFLIE